jgi:transposase
VSAKRFGDYYTSNGRTLQYYYKNHLSDFKDWTQKEHAEDWLLYAENIGKHVSLDETSLSNGELYTIFTNKDGHGKKGSIIAIVKGTKAADVIAILNKIPLEKRNLVEEVTLDMAGSMNLIAKKCFPKTAIVTDRFHVQKLASEAVQEERIRLRWEIIDLENCAILEARKNETTYIPELLANGDTHKQLLARSRYLLFKSKTNWTVRQVERAEILFNLYPTIEKAYNLAQGLRYIYENNTNKDVARLKLAHWYDKVEKSQFKSFATIARSIQMHHIPILNYFNNRSTNASAESFNAKIKEFRAQFRGVRDIKFFLYRLTKLFA